eukprot:6231877-Ditylum_brightwellii.AAC.1
MISESRAGKEEVSAERMNPHKGKTDEGDVKCTNPPKRERKKRSRKESNKGQQLESEVEFNEYDDPETVFDGIEDCNIHNAASKDESLRCFLEMVKAQRYVAWTIIFLDQDCSTAFLPSCEKYCTEKGPHCRMWNCTCDGQVRATRASAPVLGAMFVFPHGMQDEHEMDSVDNPNTNSQILNIGDNLACFILPLGPTMMSEGTPELDRDFHRMARWPVIPFHCDTSISQRWDTFRSILLQKHVTLVTFNAVVGLMPFHFHRSNDKEGMMDLILPSVWDLRLASWILIPHAKAEQLELKAKCEGFPHLQTKSSSYTVPPNASNPLKGLLKARNQLEFLFRLYPIVDKQMRDKGLNSAFLEIESPVQSILSAMECIGVGFVPKRFLGIQKQLEKKIDELVAEARSIAKDNNFLLSSPQQVSHLLFDVLNLAIPQGLQAKTVSGSQHRSTSEEALKAIQAEAKSKSNTGH